MKRLSKWALLAMVAGLGMGIHGSAVASPSAVGTYGGMSADGLTFVSFESTARGEIRRLQVAGLRALVQSEIPGQPLLPAEERSTNITQRETPTLRLQANGRFAGRFVLTGRSRADFQGATIRVSGSLRNRQGTITITLTMNKTYADGSTQGAGGEVTVPVRFTRR